MTMAAQSPHGLSCNGCDVANDDIAELERLQKIEDITHDVFRNAARIHAAMRTNRLLFSVFRKYKHVCREILQEKRAVLTHLVTLCDYCDAFQDNNPHQTKHNLKCIQSEINDINNEIKALEELQWSDDESDSDDSESDSDDDDVLDDEDEEDDVLDDEDEEDDVLDEEDEEDEDDDDDNASVESSSSSSSDSVMDMATFH